MTLGFLQSECLLFFSLLLLDSVSVILCFIFTEDIDPSVGRFRNMIQTTVIPNKVTKKTTLSLGDLEYNAKTYKIKNVDCIIPVL